MLILNNGQLIAKTLWREIVSIYDGLVFWRYLAGIWLPGCLAFVNYCYKYGFSVRFFLLFVCARDGAVLCMFFMANRTFGNCWRFIYLPLFETVLEYRRCTFTGKWRCEKRDRYGNVLGVSIRTDSEIEPIFDQLHNTAEYDFYSSISDR